MLGRLRNAWHAWRAKKQQRRVDFEYVPCNRMPHGFRVCPKPETPSLTPSSTSSCSEESDSDMDSDYSHVDLEELVRRMQERQERQDKDKDKDKDMNTAVHTCYLCLESLGRAESSCRKSCGHRYHIRCLRMDAERNGYTVCPACSDETYIV